ncbi:DUF1501 domain-containing protein [Gloeobacter morelensis]|nr:DUF1501 domain-containing protein [Gloeobacter morelensis]
MILPRRALIQAGLGSLISLGTTGWAARVQAAPDRDRRLVVVFLRGALDGLSVVVPHSDGDYYRARPRLAVPRPGKPDGAIDLDGHFGLHPALEALLPLWRRGSLAFVHACGLPAPNRSHFDAQEAIESAAPGFKGADDGWMNRLLAVLPATTAPVRAIHLGSTLPRILAGAEPVASLAPGRAATRAQPLDRPQVAAAFDALYSGSDPLSHAYREGRSARRVIQESLSSTGEDDTASNGAALPGSAFTGDARRLAQLMVRNPEVQLAFMALGGWDTHVNQGTNRGQLALRLRALGQGLAAFAAELGPLFEHTAIVVSSEFGRTVRENGNGGTDHGYGNVLWLAGGAVKGGKIHGGWPGLAADRLFEGRDLPVTTDFRSVIATVLERHLLLDDRRVQRVLPGFAAERADVMYSS